MIVVFRKLFALALGVALFKAGCPILGAIAMTGAINAWLFDVIANRVRRGDSVEVDEAAAALHESAFVADLHADVCLWERDLMKRNKRGHDAETSRRAIGLLRVAGFKIHAHLMPNPQ